MKKFLLALLLLPLLSYGQGPIFCDEDTVPIVGMELNTLRPVIKCPFAVGFVFLWPMAQPGGGGDGFYIHSMSPFTDSIYHLGVDDSHLLTPGTGWCAICVEGTDYNAVGALWGVADSAGAFTLEYNCDMVPSYDYVRGWPDKFYFDESAHAVIGGGWSITLSNGHDYEAPYSYKTPPYSGYPIYNTSTSVAPYVPYEKIRIRYTAPSGIQCTYHLLSSELRTTSAPPDFFDKKPLGYYRKSGELYYGR